MHKYKWWWYILFCGHGYVLVNVYNIYKTLCEKGKVKPMSNYEFQHMIFLENIDSTSYCGRNHLVSAVQRRGIRKQGGYTPNTTVSEQK